MDKNNKPLIDQLSLVNGKWKFFCAALALAVYAGDVMAGTNESRLSPPKLASNSEKELSKDDLYDQWFDAIKSENLEKMNFLSNQRDANGKSLIDINKKDRLGYTALMIASKKGNLDMVKWLIELGADVNVTKKAFLTSVFDKEYHDMATGRYSHTNYEKKLVSAFDKEYHDRFEKEYDVDGTTALMIAADGGYEKIIQLLIDNGAELSAKDASGKTAAQRIEEKNSKYTRVLKLLDQNMIRKSYQTLQARTKDHSDRWNELRKNEEE